jgi:hypothetical protein
LRGVGFDGDVEGAAGVTGVVEAGGVTTDPEVVNVEFGVAVTPAAGVDETVCAGFPMQ